MRSYTRKLGLSAFLGALSLASACGSGSEIGSSSNARDAGYDGAAEPVAKAFNFKFTCLSGGSQGCDFKFFFRTSDKSPVGDFAEGAADHGAIWEKSLNMNQVCDTPISTASGSLKINGQPVVGNFARGLMVAVGDRTGNYYGSWTSGLPSCSDAFQVSVNGLTVPTPVIEGTLSTGKPFTNCLISEAYFHGTHDAPLCVLLK